MSGAIDELASRPATPAMSRVLGFLASHPGFHALGALGLDVASLDEFEAVPLLIARGWIAEINGMVAITTSGRTAHAALCGPVADNCGREGVPHAGRGHA